MQVLVSSLRARGALSARQLAAESGISLSTTRRWLYRAAASGHVVAVGQEPREAGRDAAGRLWALAGPLDRLACGGCGRLRSGDGSAGGIVLHALAARTPLEIAWSVR